MKKTLFAALLALAATVSSTAFATPKASDDTVVAVYPADTIHVGYFTLVRVETIKSRKAFGQHKVYMRENEVPAAVLAEAEK